MQIHINDSVRTLMRCTVQTTHLEIEVQNCTGHIDSHRSYVSVDMHAPREDVMIVIMASDSLIVSF